MSAKTKALMLLLSATLIWGVSSPLNRHALGSIHPWSYAAFRYMFGALALLPMALRLGHRRSPVEYVYGRGARLSWLKAGLSLGSLLTLGSFFQFYGLTMTTASKSGFITSLYVPMVAMFGFVAGQIPRKEVWAGLGLCLTGLVLISGPSEGGGGFNFGDALTLLADIIWAFHMIVMGYFAVRVNSWLLVCSQASACCLMSLLIANLTGNMCTIEEFVKVWPFLAWGVMSVSVAYVCQAKAQISIPPTATAITLQFQPVLGAACGIAFLGEPLAWYTVLGAAVLVTGALVAQRAGDSFRISRANPRYRLVLAARISVVVLIASACALSVVLTMP